MRPTLRREIEASISGPDVTVHAVTPGPEVVAYVTKEAPDLVIVDMQMGNMGGMAVCMSSACRSPTTRWTTLRS